MPFVAHDRETKERIDITRYRNPRAELQAERLICQLCGVPMIIRQGLVIRPHFAHTRSCSTPYASHPESPEHLLGKETVSTWLRKQQGFEGATVELEVPIHARKRIADIFVTFPQGHKLAVEIQLASITPGDLAARTKDYFDDDTDVIWVLGKDALRGASNVQWCTTVLGGYLQLGFTTEHPVQDLGRIGTSDTEPPMVVHATAHSAW
jgi:competence protein CoiA